MPTSLATLRRNTTTTSLLYIRILCVEESGEQCTVVFALIVTEPAPVRNNNAKTTFSKFLHGLICIWFTELIQFSQKVKAKIYSYLVPYQSTVILKQEIARKEVLRKKDNNHKGTKERDSWILYEGKWGFIFKHAWQYLISIHLFSKRSKSVGPSLGSRTG